MSGVPDIGIGIIARSVTSQSAVVVKTASKESTGDRTILGKISKRGNKYLRTLFVQAAHVVLVRRPHGARLGLWPWIETAGRRLHRNMLVIALAHKLARIAWAVLARGHAYQPRSVSQAV